MDPWYVEYPYALGTLPYPWYPFVKQTSGLLNKPLNDLGNTKVTMASEAVPYRLGRPVA